MTVSDSGARWSGELGTLMLVGTLDGDDGTSDLTVGTTVVLNCSLYLAAPGTW